MAPLHGVPRQRAESAAAAPDFVANSVFFCNAGGARGAAP